MLKLIVLILILIPGACYGQEVLWNYHIGAGIWSASLSSNGRYVAAGSFVNITAAGGNIFFFDSGGKLLWSYTAGDTVWSVSVSGTGEYVAAGSKDKYVYFFNADGKLLWKYKTGGAVWSVSLSENGEYVAAGSYDNNVYLFDRAGKLLWKYKTDNVVLSTSTSQDGSYVAAGSYDNNVYLFDRAGKLLWKYKTDDVVLSTSTSQDGSYVAAGSYDNNVYLFDRAGKLLWRYRTNNVVVDASISADGSYVAAGSYDNNVYLFDRAGKLLWKYKTDDEVWDVSISDNGGLIVAGSRDYNVYFFNTSGELLGKYGTNYFVSTVSTSSDGNFTIAGSYDTNLYFFKRALPLPELPKIPELLVTRTINKSVLVEGENARITVNIQNAGEGQALDIRFSEITPASLEPVGGETSWTGDLKPKESKTLSYEVRAKLEGDVRLPELKVSYKDSAGNEYLATSEALEISIKKLAEERPRGAGLRISVGDILMLLGLVLIVFVFAAATRFSKKEEPKEMGDLLKRLRSEVGLKEVESPLVDSNKPIYEEKSRLFDLIKKEMKK
jgi:WD40 repeat protein